MNFQMFKLVLEKAEEPEIKLPTSVRLSKKQESSNKTSALLTTPKPLTVWIKIQFSSVAQSCLTLCNPMDCSTPGLPVHHQNKPWKILKEMGIPDHLTYLLRNLYEGQEATVRTGHGTTDWFQIEKGVCQGCILSPCLFNFAAEYLL